MAEGLKWPLDWSEEILLIIEKQQIPPCWKAVKLNGLRWLENFHQNSLANVISKVQSRGDSPLDSSLSSHKALANWISQKSRSVLLLFFPEHSGLMPLETFFFSSIPLPHSTTTRRPRPDNNFVAFLKCFPIGEGKEAYLPCLRLCCAVKRP